MNETLNTVKHNAACTMAFGRPSKHSNCPRCEQLKAGAAPRAGWRSIRAEAEAATLRAIAKHDFSNPFDTAFQW